MNDSPLILSITDLGGLGDGIARHEGATLFIPYTCPGDIVSADMPPHTSRDAPHAILREVLTPSPDRQPAACAHFGTCGGCSLQHLKPAAYSAFKQHILTSLLTRLRVTDADIMTLTEAGPGTRRRASFSISVHKGDIRLGFSKARSHELVHLAMCPVLDTRITDLLPLVQSCLQQLHKPGLLRAVQLTALPSGLDVLVTVSARIPARDREALTRFADSAALLRLAMHTGAADEPVQHTECLWGTGAARLTFGDVEVELPPGAFLQASAVAEQAITGFVVGHLAGQARVADFYAGCGTYSFPLSTVARQVAAYEGSEPMVQALASAVRRAGLHNRLQASVRDLYTHPLRAEELSVFDAAVINPPRNGAMPQVQQLAKSSIAKITMVSCNPATFERDAGILLQGGYRLTHAAAIDQFTWSSHLEIVAVFSR